MTTKQNECFYPACGCDGECQSEKSAPRTITTEQMRNALAPLRWIPTDRHQWHIALGGRFFAMRGSAKGNKFTVWETVEDGLIRSELAGDVTREEVDAAVLRAVVPDGMAERNPTSTHEIKGEGRLSMKAQIEALAAERDALAKRVEALRGALAEIGDGSGDGTIKVFVKHTLAVDDPKPSA